MFRGFQGLQVDIFRDEGEVEEELCLKAKIVMELNQRWIAARVLSLSDFYSREEELFLQMKSLVPLQLLAASATNLSKSDTLK